MRVEEGCVLVSHSGARRGIDSVRDRSWYIYLDLYCLGQSAVDKDCQVQVSEAHGKGIDIALLL